MVKPQVAASPATMSCKTASLNHLDEIRSKLWIQAIWGQCLGLDAKFREQIHKTYGPRVQNSLVDSICFSAHNYVLEKRAVFPNPKGWSGIKTNTYCFSLEESLAQRIRPTIFLTGKTDLQKIVDPTKF